MTGCAGTELRLFLELVSPLNWSLPCFAQRLTYLLTPWSRVLLEKLTGLQLVKKFLAFYGTRRFITALTSSRYLTLSWPSSIHTPISEFLKIRLNIILSSTTGSPKWSLFLRFPHQNPVYASLLPHTHYISPPHLILLDVITWTIFGEQYRSLSCIYIYMLAKVK